MDIIKEVLEYLRVFVGVAIVVLLASEQAESASFGSFIATKLVGLLVGLIIGAILTLVINKIDD